jgi:hypothetical protein
MTRWFIWVVILIVIGATFFEIVPFRQSGVAKLSTLSGMSDLEGSAIGKINVRYYLRLSPTYSGVIFSGRCSESEFVQLGSVFGINLSKGSGAYIDFKGVAGLQDLPKDIFSDFSSDSLDLFDQSPSRARLQVTRDPKSGNFTGIIVGKPNPDMQSGKSGP